MAALAHHPCFPWCSNLALWLMTMVDKVHCGCGQGRKGEWWKSKEKGDWSLYYVDPDICLQFGGEYFCNEVCYRQALKTAGFELLDPATL